MKRQRKQKKRSRMVRVKQIRIEYEKPYNYRDPEDDLKL